MGSGALGQRRVQASQPQHDGRLTSPLGEDVRSAPRAKAAELAGRRFETGQELLSPRPAKMLPRHRRDGGEGRALRLPARPAMAVHDRPGRRVDLVGYASAHAAADEQVRAPVDALSKPASQTPGQLAPRAPSSATPSCASPGRRRRIGLKPEHDYHCQKRPRGTGKGTGARH
jgi:hypothetical protein